MTEKNDTKVGRKASVIVRDQLAGNKEMVVFNINALTDEEVMALRRAALDVAALCFDASVYRQVGRKLEVL